MQYQRESRFRVAAPHHVKVVFERADGRSPAIISGELLDMSRGGAKLFVAQALQNGENVLMRIEDAAFDLRLSVSANVGWIKRSGDRFGLGVVFSPSLPESTIGEMLTKGILERRLAPRKETRVPLQARWECSASAEPRDVDLIDISPGGFCLRSAVPAVVGSRMRLLTRDNERHAPEINAKVRWQLDEKNGFLIGCELNGMTSAAKLHEIVFGVPFSDKELACQPSMLERIRERLTDIRQRPKAALVRWLGLNEHEQILHGTQSNDRMNTPAGKP
ncbi:MAG: PilZ domain-containing protein [Pirellulales bacterium]